MKFLEFILVAVVCFGVAGTSKLSTKYLPPNFAAVRPAGSAHYSHYQAANGAATRARPSVGHQYAAAISIPGQTVLKIAHTKAAAQIPIVRSDYNNDGNGNYNFGFETGNGIKRSESGHIQGSWPAGSLKVAGSYSYTGDDGKLYSVNYKADSNGFQAEGDHLPTPPPIPREIQETLHLHQRSPATSFTLPPSGGHKNFVSPSHVSPANVFAPNADYLPPQQSQGYYYGRHH